jgi:RecA-family ATPase
VTIFGGDGKVAKSILAMQLCVCTVANKEWLGKTPAQGPVIYLSEEDDLDELNRRFQAMPRTTASN